jgi:hypothetical protein
LESQIYEDNSKRITLLRDVCKIIKIVNNFTLNLMLRAAREPHHCSHSWNIIYYSILYKCIAYTSVVYVHKCGLCGKTIHFRFGCKCVLCNVPMYDVVRVAHVVIREIAHFQFLPQTIFFVQIFQCMLTFFSKLMTVSYFDKFSDDLWCEESSLILKNNFYNNYMYFLFKI